MMTQHEIDWIDGQPYSKLFGDIFFSRDSGLEEAHHVFLNGNALPQRWRNLRPGEVFVIGETGFGTGLNFLAAVNLWNQVTSEARLHFFSFEKHPLSVEAMAATHALWPELNALGGDLRAQYHAFSPGWHRLNFQNGSITLTLVIGDAFECLPRMRARAHAWFLDGFSPATNPSLWSADLLGEVARHSHAQATLATYTSAGHVRRALQAAGFVVRKAPGFGRKREMVIAHKEGDMSLEQGASRDRKAIVIGAGIAGCSAAHSLAQRGWKVAVFERAAKVAAGASGIPQAALHARLARRMLPAHQIGLLGYQYSVRLFRQLLNNAPSMWHQCGSLQLDHASRRLLNADELSSLQLPEGLAKRVTQAEAEDICGMGVSSGGIHFPLGGWIHGPELCNRLARHPLIDLRYSSPITDITWLPSENRWQVHDINDNCDMASNVIVANAHDAGALTLTRHLPLHRIGGQITLAQATSESARLRSVLCGEGVVTPSRKGRHTIGATYNHARSDTQISADEHADNWNMANTLAPAFVRALRRGDDGIAGHVAFRTTSPDRTPLASELQCTDAPGLFVSLAHGSRGFSTGPLLGECIASAMEEEPLPLPSDLILALDANRFN